MDTTTPPPATTTMSADNVIATTPPPVEESFQSVLERQLKKKPKIDRVDYKSLDQIPEGVAAPQGMDVVSDTQVSEYLKKIETGTEQNQNEKQEPEKQESKKSESKSDDFDFSLEGVDLSKDPEPVLEEKKPTKKSKEENIAELRKKAEAYESEVKTRDEKLAEYQKKLDEMEAELERTAFERSSVFKKDYQAPYEEAISEASEYAKLYNEDPKVTEKAMSLTGKERTDFIDESFGGGAAAGEFVILLNKAESKRKALEKALANSREAMSAHVESEQNVRAQNHDTINKNIDKVVKHLATKSEYFRMSDDEEHNKAVRSRIDVARSIATGTASENDIIMAPLLASIAKDVISENKRLAEENSKLKNRVLRDNSVSPSPRRGSSDNGEESSKPVGAVASIRKYFR
jgi:hypothetical protein